jgi:hypothetical protein
MPYPLRMSNALRERLTAQAKEHDRSLHAEIIAILEGSTGLAEAIPGVEVKTLAEEIAEIVAAKLKVRR